jgi:hypothetical protein
MTLLCFHTAQPVRTAHSLVCSTLWSGYGWGKGQVDGQHLLEYLGKKSALATVSDSNHADTAPGISMIGGCYQGNTTMCIAT